LADAIEQTAPGSTDKHIPAAPTAHQ